jgi:hypothetical protein
MSEWWQLDVFGDEERVVPSPPEDPVVVRREVASWWIQDELPLSSE